MRWTMSSAVLKVCVGESRAVSEARSHAGGVERQAGDLFEVRVEIVHLASVFQGQSGEMDIREGKVMPPNPREAESSPVRR